MVEEATQTTFLTQDSLQARSGSPRMRPKTLPGSESSTGKARRSLRHQSKRRAETHTPPGLRIASPGSLAMAFSRSENKGVTRNLPSLPHSRSDYEDRNPVFPLVFRGKADRLIERVNPTACPAHRGDVLPGSAGRALSALPDPETRERAQLLTACSRRQTGQRPVGGPAPRPCAGESAGTRQGYKREPHDSGTESPDRGHQ